jgi:hypothetical protein
VAPLVTAGQLGECTRKTFVRAMAAAQCGSHVVSRPTPDSTHRDPSPTQPAPTGTTLLWSNTDSASQVRHAPPQPRRLQKFRRWCFAKERCAAPLGWPPEPEGEHEPLVAADMTS